MLYPKVKQLRTIGYRVLVEDELLIFKDHTSFWFEQNSTLETKDLANHPEA